MLCVDLAPACRIVSALSSRLKANQHVEEGLHSAKRHGMT